MAGATISDVADRANVSVATVDRVLHGRSGVSDKSRQSVKDAIHSLGFGQLPPQLIEQVRAKLKFLFLLPKLETGFVSEMDNSICSTHSPASNIKLEVEIRRVNLTTGAEIIAELQNLDPEEFQGVGLFAFDAPGVREAINNVRERGVSVATLVSDVPSSQRDCYIGIDNTAAGRTVGRLMGKFLRGVSGDIGIITGNMNIRDHMERQMGFRQIIGADYPQLKLLLPEEGDSIADKNCSIATRMLKQNPDLVGIYAIGGGNSGVIRALRNIQPANRPAVVLHEVTKETHLALNEGIIDAVVAQNTDHIARGAIASLIAASLNETIDESQASIGISIYLAENLA